MPTTVNHEALAGVMVYMFAEMTDGAAAANADTPGEPVRDATEADAGLATARFRSLSEEIRGCAIIGPRGVLAATGDSESWQAAANALLEAADAAAGARAAHAHVATEEGEAYAVRHAGLAMVAVTDRFTLASLVLADMRAALRTLAESAVAPRAEAA